MAEELDNLLIKIDSEMGDLKGLDSAISSLQTLANFNKDASNGIKQIGNLGTAFHKFDNLKLDGLSEASKSIRNLVGALDDLSKVGNVAQKTFNQFGKLGKTLKDNFDGIGTSLKGINEVSEGVNGLVKAFDSLAKVTNPAKGVIRQFGELGDSLQHFKDINIKDIADRIADPLERIMKAMGNLGNNNRISIRIDQNGIANVNRINQSMRRTMTTFREFANSVQNDRANVRGMFNDMLDVTQPTEDLQRNLTRAERMLSTFENNARTNAERVRTALSNFAPRDLLNNQSVRNALRANLMNDTMANEIRTQIDNARHEIETRGQQEVSEAWAHVEQSINDNIQQFNLSEYMDFSLPLDQLRANLRRMENELARAQRMMQSAQDNMARLRAQNRDENALRADTGYRGSYFTFTTQTHHVREYTQAIRQLQDVINRQQTMPQGNIESLRMLPQLTHQLQQYQAVYQQMQSIAEPSDEQRSQMVVIERALDIISGRIDGIRNALTDGQILDSEEGILERMRQIADEAERANREMEQMRGQSLERVTQGFGQFGSMLSGTNLPVVRELGNLSSMFGRSGARFLSTEQLAGLEGIAGTLGTVATALGQVGAVVSVVVAVFKTWWDTMGKVKQALTQFVQSCIQFAKNMLTKVVGAFNAVAGAVSKVASAVRSGAEVIVSALRKIGDVTKNVFSVLGKIGGALAPAVQGVKALLSAVTPRFVKTLASSNGSLKNIIKNTRILNKLLHTAGKWFTMISRMLMRKTVQAFISGLKQAFDDLVVFEMNAGDALLRLNENVSMIFSAMRRGANQWIAGFEPLINAFTPMIVGFLDGIQSMGEAFAKFMAILTGQPYYIRAKRFYESYGQNVEQTTKKVKNLTNGLDELNILSANKDSDGIDPADMFEKVYIDDVLSLPSLNDFIDKIVDWLKNIDWEKIWDKIKEVIGRLMDMVNEFLSRLDLAEWLGKTLGNLLNTVFVILEELGNKFDPHALADWITTLIINALNEIDWDRINRVVETWASKLAQFWNDIFANDELWNAITNTITNFLNEVVHYFDTWAWTFDFSQMAQTLTDAVTRILQGFDWEQLRHAVEGWVGGLVSFINTAIANKEFWRTLGDSIENVINDVIIEAFGELAKLDLVGLSDSLKQMIQHALDGIKWDDLNNSFSEFATKLANAINNFFGDEEFLTEITTAIANFANAIIGSIDDFITNLKGYDIGKAIGEALQKGLGTVDWNTIFKLPADAINALSDALRGLLDSIPANFNLGKWLTDHLKLTLDGIKWDEIEKNIQDLAKQITDFINGVLGNEEFWATAGQTTGRVIRIGLDFIFEIFNVNGEDLGTAIVNYVNGLINEVDIGKYISKTVDVFVNLVVALDTVFTGVDWGTIGDQIGQGIADAIDKLFANRGLIRQTIEDAFSAVSTLFNKVLVKMVSNGSFYKLGQIIGDVILGVITGISDFFDANLDEILEAMEQFAKGIAKYLHDNHDEIVEKLNNIIDAVCAIIIEFFNDKSALMKEINDILRDLDLDKLLHTLIEVFIKKLFAKLKNLEAISESTGGLGSILADLVGTFMKELLKYLWGSIVDGWKKFWENPTDSLGGFELTGGGIIGFFAELLGFKDGKIDLSGLFDNLKFTGLAKAWETFKSKLASVVDFFKKKISDIKEKGLFKGLFGKDEEEVPVKLKPTVDEESADSWDDLFDEKKKVPIELEDPKLGKITAELIEAEVIKVIDIFADKLHVGEIDSDMSGKKEMDKFYGANENNANGGTLSKDKGDLYVENIFAQLLDVKKILSELLEVGEKIMTPLLEVSEKITTPLIDAKKITTKLLDAKKIVTKLLEAEKMWTKFLEVRDEILTQELKVEKKTTTKLFEIDRVSVKDNGLGNFTASIDNLDKLFVPLIESFKLAVEEFEANTMALQTLKVTTFTAKGLDVDVINAQALNLGQIIANTLRVGSIVSGGGLGLTNVVDNGYNEHGGEYYIEKPQFAKDDRWSDISGLVPSAEDFLRGFDDVYKGVYDGIYDSYQKTIGTVTQPVNLGDYSTGITQGTLSNDGTQGVWVGNHIGANGSVWNQADGSYSTVKLDDEAQARYIRDYLMKEIGNEAGVYGLMGNLYAESGLKSNNLQDTNGSLGVTQKDIDYTNNINNGANFLDNKGYGLAQWTTSDRKEKLQNSLGGSSIDDLDGQLAYLVKELKTDFPNVWNSLKNASSNYEASTAVLEGFEKPKDASDKISERASYSNQIAGILGDDSYNIPDEPVPTTDTPQDNEPNLYDGFDEAHVVDITDDGSGGYSGTPFSFLETLPIQTEFVMAEVYNVIDKWLGRIYRLFKSFNVDEFLKDLVELDEIELDLDGKLKLDVFDNIEKALKKLIELIEQLIKDGIKCTCDCKCDGGADIYDDLVNALHDCGFPADDTHLKNNTDAKSKNTKAVESLNKLIREGGLVCNCNCKCDGGAGAYDDIVHAMHDCGFPADDTHLRNNTDAKSKNTKAVEGLNNTMNRMADCCQNNYAMTERMVGAIGDWIRCAGDTGHLDNNTKAKSDNTRAIEDLNRNIGGFISNLQGALSNVTCNCNCGGNCGNCAMGQSGGGQPSGGGYNPPNNGYNPPVGNNTGGGGYNPSNNSTDDGGYNPSNNGTSGGGYNPPNYYDGSGGGQPSGGVLDRNGGNNSGDNNNNNGGGNNNDNGGGNNNGNNGNNNDRGVDPKTGIPYGLAPTFDPRTGLTTFTDNEGNLFPEYGQRKVKNFGDDPNAEWATGFFEAEFNREQEEKKRAEEAQKKREEEAKKKNEEARQKNNELVPAVKPYVTDENGIRTFTSDKYKELFDSENKKVEEMRKKGKEYLDNVNKYGTEEEKKSAESYYNELMTNKGSTSTDPYEFNLEKLEDLSAKAVTANALGSEIKEARLGTNGNIFAIKDLIKSDTGKALLANALISNRDAQGNEIYWFKKGNGSANSAMASDRIDDPEVIATIKDGIKKLGVTEDMADFGKKNQSLYDLYKTVLSSSADDETKNEARLAFQKALAWTYNSSTPARADEYINKLKELAGVNEDTKDSSKKNTDAKDGFMEQFKQAVDDGWEISTSRGNSSASSPFKDVELLEKVFEGLRKNTSIGYVEPRGVPITSDARNLAESDIKSLFDYWYQNRFLVKGYQLGGMPNAGEMFVARENGTPEYVGSFGNKTAVANNDQIVTAVANGVSMANDRVVNAIQSQTESLSNTIDRKDLNVQIGDRQIAEANNRGQRGLGNKFVE